MDGLRKKKYAYMWTGPVVWYPGGINRTHQPNKHYGRSLLCRVFETLGKAPKTLGKGFAECNTRQRALGSEYSGKDVFAECLLSGTRQRFCLVSGRRSAKKSRHDGVWDRDGSLPSALWKALGKGPSLCRAPSVRRSAKAGSLPSTLG
jgi:hypothetical protein